MHAYSEKLIQLYRRYGDQDVAKSMKQYMRNQFEFLGLKTPLRREIFKTFLKEQGLPSTKQDLRVVVIDLWESPEREYQMVAMDILGKSKRIMDADDLSFIEYLIITKSWWDTVDFLASNMVGAILLNDPSFIDVYTEKWNNHDNMWLQRTALLFQLKYKEKTDDKRLFRYILDHVDSNEFFIQKAIGWALREYSKTEPDLVRAFIDRHELKPLSRREGLKWVNQQKQKDASL
ncbi:DNA alkylation repair protein [Terrilactibacillus laevilacticus]|uniref:DNA alkylation repair protein n=1 Tax=Terrilactibacillus laevilacticus TaxID=1380157 RepID=A0ABW5PMF3_9BACI|nr:DNA alkylation repair protein [Terrilactibacillus laevilacticus]